VPYAKVRWTYDPLGRRIQRESWQGANPVVVTRYVYDGWQCLAELDGSNAVTATYAWGIDLSVSRTGAGGVGGLLWVNHMQHGRHFYSYDGNGNVCGLTSASDGTRTGGYEYDPFGGIIRANEVHPVAGWNEWKYSTKPSSYSVLELYELRVREPARGGWLSRDPLEEDAGPALSGFLQNSPVNSIDDLGLSEFKFEVGLGNFADSSNILLYTRQDRRWTRETIFREFMARNSRCHTCGVRLGPFQGVADHQPALAIGPAICTCRQCLSCSGRQGRAMLDIVRGGGPAIRAARATVLLGMGSVGLLGAGVDKIRESDDAKVARGALDSYSAAVDSCRQKAWELQLETCSCCVVVGTHQYRYPARRVSPLLARVRRAFGLKVVHEEASGGVIMASFRGTLIEGGCDRYQSHGYLHPADVVMTEEFVRM